MILDNLIILKQSKSFLENIFLNTETNELFYGKITDWVENRIIPVQFYLVDENVNFIINDKLISFVDNEPLPNVITADESLVKLQNLQSKENRNVKVIATSDSSLKTVDQLTKKQINDIIIKLNNRSTNKKCSDCAYCGELVCRLNLDRFKHCIDLDRKLFEPKEKTYTEQELFDYLRSAIVDFNEAWVDYHIGNTEVNKFNLTNWFNEHKK